MDEHRVTDKLKFHLDARNIFLASRCHYVEIPYCIHYRGRYRMLVFFRLDFSDSLEFGIGREVGEDIYTPLPAHGLTTRVDGQDVEGNEVILQIEHFDGAPYGLTRGWSAPTDLPIYHYVPSSFEQNHLYPISPPL